MLIYGGHGMLLLKKSKNPGNFCQRYESKRKERI